MLNPQMPGGLLGPEIDIHLYFTNEMLRKGQKLHFKEAGLIFLKSSPVAHARQSNHSGV